MLVPVFISRVFVMTDNKPKPPARIHPVKTEVRIHTLREVGADIEDLKEKAEADSYRADGGGRWLGRMEKALKAIEEHLSKRFHEGRIQRSLTDAEATALAQEYLQKVRQSIGDLAAQATGEKLGQQAMAEGYRKVMDKVKKKVDTDVLRLEHLMLELKKQQDGQTSPEETPPELTRDGPHTTPAAEELRERKAKAKAEKAKKAAETPSDQEPPAEKKPVKRVRKKRVRKKKSTTTE